MDRLKTFAGCTFIVLCSGADGLVEVVAAWLESFT